MVVEFLVGVGCGVIANLICDSVKDLLHFKH